jgi:histone-lysine N-methyltransferase SETMAR
MITLFFTARKLIVLEVLPKGGRFNQQSFVDCIFPDLKRAHVNFHRRKTGRTFWVHMNNSMCENGSKIISTFAKHHLLRMPHPPDSPDISPCDCWLFGLLKRIFKDREFSSSEQVEEAITPVWNDLSFEDVPSVFQNWVSRLACVIETGEEYLYESKRMDLQELRERGNAGPGLFFPCPGW